MCAAIFRRARCSLFVPARSSRPNGRRAGGAVVDKSAAVGALTARRRYLETIAAEAGDVDITKYPVLVSIGRGIEEQENVAIAAGSGGCAGRRGELLAAGGGRQVDGEIAAGGIVRPDREAQGLPGLRHQRLVPAPGGH